MTASQWRFRRAVIDGDLARAQTHYRPNWADIEALEKYVAWLRKKELSVPRHPQLR